MYFIPTIPNHSFCIGYLHRRNPVFEGLLQLGSVVGILAAKFFLKHHISPMGCHQLTLHIERLADGVASAPGFFHALTPQMSRRHWQVVLRQQLRRGFVPTLQRALCRSRDFLSVTKTAPALLCAGGSARFATSWCTAGMCAGNITVIKDARSARPHRSTDVSDTSPRPAERRVVVLSRRSWQRHRATLGCCRTDNRG